ncbi:UPF0716 protein FxsA [Natronobacillus azotifigens]|uniref:Membrane protein FxsA n=1 Tax=Natronobacillus azotifigens TaxID=472978 RepID=A0A9J6RHS0_9BACI|nr:FxsA family protein [Natronobacillus azotifigens]MCZ0704665.1 membrane protein FxsA [Natronobacillus azotifigens]
MFRWLFLLILIVPALEIGVFIWAGGKIGGLSVIGLIILTGLFGATLAKQQGTETLRRAQTNMNTGQLPAEEIFDGICILIGAIVLLTPGFITDIFGFLLLLPVTRNPLKVWLKAIVQQMINKGSVTIYRR